MAKEKQTKEVILTEENIVVELEKKNRMTTALTKEMLEEIKKEKDDRIRNQVRSRFLKATYQRDLALLQRKYSKKKSEIALYKIRQTGRLVRFLTGFTVDESTLEYAKTEDDVFKIETLNEKDKTITLVVDKKSSKKETFKVGDEAPATIDVVDYDNLLNDLQAKISEMQSKAEEEHNTNCNKLRLAYGEYWNNDWRW